MSEKSKQLNMLEQRLEVAEGENHEDLESKLKEMNHLLELEKLERANIEAELGLIPNFFKRRVFSFNDPIGALNHGRPRQDICPNFS